MDQTQRRLFAELERANHYVFCDPSPEAKRIAVAAMRRYRAYVERDWKTLWEETEALLIQTRTVLELSRADLTALDLRVRQERTRVLATIQEIQGHLEPKTPRQMFNGC
jgi:hypothetical protein